MARNSPYRLLPGSCANSEMFTQEKLKDCVDLSKNLVSGELVREYPKMEKSGRKTMYICQCVVFVAVAGLAAWLLGMTLIRERQLARMDVDMRVMRSQIDILNIFTDKIKSEIESMKKQMEADKNLINEMNSFEDEEGIYADVDHTGGEAIEDSFARAPQKSKSSDRTLDLDSITTVLEDDEDFGEDNYEEDGEDEESGDYYMDYDKRNNGKVGASGMEKLNPEAFLGKVLNARPMDRPDTTSKLHELRRILTQTADPSDDAIDATSEQRLKRSVVDSAADALDSIDEFAAPRLIRNKIEERRKTKKYAPLEAILDEAPEQQRPTVARHELPRHTRNSDDGDSHAFVAAHFHGNTSHLSTELHEHYKGNGLVRVAHDAAHDVWFPAPWTLRAPTPRPTLTRAGHVHVPQTGVYFVYVQIYYLDAHDITGWVLHRTSYASPEREPILQCATSAPSLERRDKPNSCYSAAALFLYAGDLLAVRNTGGDRHSLMQPEKSFIGLIKLADAKEPFNEY